MADRQCPLCGNPVNGDEAICNDCSENTQRRDSINFSTEEENDVEPEERKDEQDQPDSDNTSENTPYEQPVKPKKSRTRREKRLLMTFFVGIFLILAIGVVVFITNKNLQRDKDAELNYWYSCIEENTPLSYSKYLLVYPEGKFSQEARSKITELRQEEVKEWENLKKSADAADYRQFLDIHPATPFKNDIIRIIDSLSWETATKENTAESYQFYLENVRLGNAVGYYKGVAEQRYDYMSKVKELDKEEFGKIEKTITNYFSALSSQDYNKLAEIMDRHLANFYGVTNYSSDIILSTMKSDVEKNNIKSLVYTPDLSSMKAFKDGDGLYVLQLATQKKISYKTKKKDEVNSEKLHLDITPYLKVKSMYAVDKN